MWVRAMFCSRLEDHYKKKNFWTDGVIFTSENQNLNKAHVRYLEAQLVELADEAKRCDLDNATHPQRPSLSPADEADAKQYLKNMLLCLLAVGVSFFEKPREPESQGRFLRAEGATVRAYAEPVRSQGMSNPLALLQGVTDWDAYREALKQWDQLWAARRGYSVLRKAPSWFTTVQALHEVVKQDWGQLDDGTGKQLLGLGGTDDGWALLGHMRPAAFTVIFGNDHNRNTVQDAVHGIIAADDNKFPDAAIEAYEIITGINGLATATATRLLTLARPDRIVSLNDASRAGLAQYCDLKLSKQISAEKYRSVLDRLYTKPWFNAPPPEEPREHAIWSMRTALVDCFMYTGKPDESAARSP